MQPMKSAACSGGAGDIIYSIPIMRKLGVSTYYIKRNHYLPPHSNLFETVAPLIQQQGFECIPTSGEYIWGSFEPNLVFDYDIDSFRNMPYRNVIHIMLNMAIKFRVDRRGLFKAWLKDITPIYYADNLIHLTERWREGSTVDWLKVRDSMEGSMAFIGFKHEHTEFEKRYGKIKWLQTANLLQLAELIAGCKRLYCNQTCSLAIAQGIGKEYWLEKKPNKLNTIMKTSNEHIL
jgi:hypothetical protein